MRIYTARDIYEHALEVERLGAEFYKKLADKAKTRRMKELFLKFSEDEYRHYDAFNKLIENVVEDYELKEANENLKEFENLYQELSDLEEDDMEDIKVGTEKVPERPKSLSKINDKIFNRMDNLKKFLKVVDDISLVNVLIKIELDVIYFYTNIRGRVMDGEWRLINPIINEEKKHLDELLVLRSLWRRNN